MYHESGLTISWLVEAYVVFVIFLALSCTAAVGLSLAWSSYNEILYNCRASHISCSAPRWFCFPKPLPWHHQVAYAHWTALLVCSVPVQMGNFTMHYHEKTPTQNKNNLLLKRSLPIQISQYHCVNNKFSACFPRSTRHGNDPWGVDHVRSVSSGGEGG